MVKSKSTKLITKNSPSHPLGCECKMTQKRNVVLYLDRDLVEKSRDFGFNLSRTFEKALKQLINTYLSVNFLNNNGNNKVQNGWWAGPDLNRRPLARKANVLTKLDDRPQH
jgi:post-segregation antitoxin (ccd killing protein)